MQKHEKWAVWLIAGVFVSSMYTAFFAGMVATQFSDSTWWYPAGRLVVGNLVNLAVGAWLYVTAKRDGNSRWVWGAVGIAFSLLGAVLYFLLRALSRLPTVQPSAPTGSRGHAT